METRHRLSWKQVVIFLPVRLVVDQFNRMLTSHVVARDGDARSTGAQCSLRHSEIFSPIFGVSSCQRRSTLVRLAWCRDGNIKTGVLYE